MDKAIKRLKEMVEEQTDFIDKLESGEIKLPEDQPIERIESLIHTYRFWAMCLSTTAYLLESDQRKGE